MTAVETASSAEVERPEAEEPPKPPEAEGAAPSAPRQKAVIEYVAGALGLLSLMVAGFAVYLYGLSSISEARVQATMYRTFRGELGQGVAPVGPSMSVYNSDGTQSTVQLADGAPMAILNIPQINLKNAVVVQGTTSRDLTRGPGHLPSTVFPGQAGVSVILGKEATFGAPFAHLMRLNRGDRFTVTTGQGVATYEVESFGADDHLPPDKTANQLILMTADSSFAPSTVVTLSADLVSSPQPAPSTAMNTSDDNYLAGDTGAWVPLVLWSQALLVTSLLGTLAARRWSRWPVYLAAAPVVIALTWCVYENVATLLPNVY